MQSRRTVSHRLKSVAMEQRAQKWEQQAVAAAGKGDFERAAVCWRYAALEYRNALGHASQVADEEGGVQ